MITMFREPQDKLWNALREFSLEQPGISSGFSQRLAQENGWTAQFTAQVIEEYKRFIYLCATQEQIIAPSEIVDKAWHTHLTYTRSYYDGMCRLIGRIIHHEPGSVDTSDPNKYKTAYQNTLRLYQFVFGANPPRKIWTRYKAEKHCTGDTYCWMGCTLLHCRADTLTVSDAPQVSGQHNPNTQK
jgi:hypothetical protein